MNAVVFDIETIGDINKFNDLELTVISIYEYRTNKYQSFLKTELKNLWPILEKADLIIGYNSEHFDVPILNKYYLGDLTKIPHVDLMARIKDSLGFRLKLNDVAKATLDNIEKSANGLLAQTWWQEGKIDEVKKYCEQDVRVTKELYEFGLKNKQLFYKKLAGEVTPFRVNFELTPNQANSSTKKNINLTLPF